MLRITEQEGHQAISFILRYGTQVSAAVMALALVRLVGLGLPPSLVAVQGVTTGALLAGLLRLDPVALAQSGIFLLLLTPVLRIIVAAGSFALERDYKYLLISLGVLAVVLWSIHFAAR